MRWVGHVISQFISPIANIAMQHLTWKPRRRCDSGVSTYKNLSLPPKLMGHPTTPGNSNCIYPQAESLIGILTKYMQDGQERSSPVSPRADRHRRACPPRAGLTGMGLGGHPFEGADREVCRPHIPAKGFWIKPGKTRLMDIVHWHQTPSLRESPLSGCADRTPSDQGHASPKQKRRPRRTAA